MGFDIKVGLGPKNTEFIHPLNLKKIAKSATFGEGVVTFSRDFFPIYDGLTKLDLSPLSAHLADKFKGFEEIQFSEVKAEVDKVAEKAGLNVELRLLHVTDETEGELPLKLEKTGVMCPVLVPKGFDTSIRSSISVFVRGEDAAKLLLVIGKGGVEALAKEGKAGLDIKDGDGATARAPRGHA